MGPSKPASTNLTNNNPERYVPDTSIVQIM